MKTESRLEKVLAAGHFAVTAECGPPKGADRAALETKGKSLLGYVDAINVTDNQTAIVRMSSLAACAILKALGHEPVLQMVTRDRNRIALQSDLFGAYALGIRNVLCLTGDHHCFGNQKEAVGVFDLDSIQLVRTVKDMRDKAAIIGGEPIQVPPKLFIGAAANPFADPPAWRAVRMAKKVAAGVDFIQTQCIFNVDKFVAFMDQAQVNGPDRKGEHTGRHHAHEERGYGPVHGHQGSRYGSPGRTPHPYGRRPERQAGGRRNQDCRGNHSEGP